MVNEKCNSHFAIATAAAAVSSTASNTISVRIKMTHEWKWQTRKLQRKKKCMPLEKEKKCCKRENVICFIIMLYGSTENILLNYICFAFPL